jgi:hypothetical protein
MKSTSALLTALLLVALSVRAEAAATYYVSQSSGHDASDGQSPATAWKTLAKASQVSYLPGDRILLKCGDTWANDALRPQGSGTPDNPVVISSYGQGNKPLLDGLDDQQDRIAIYLVDVEGYKIVGLEFARYRSGVFAHYGADQTPKRYLWIEDWESSSGPTRPGSASSSATSPSRIAGSSGCCRPSGPTIPTTST